MIVPTDSASQRTKNRLREHNLEQQRRVTDKPSNMAAFTLFKCMDKDCDWFGWLPNNEFAVKELV